MILVLTVGTGTAGQHSNLAAGLVNSIASLSESPEITFLVPSSSEESIALAELVADESPYHAEIADEEFRLENPDDLLASRDKIRALLESVIFRFPKSKILVNPTSGTKQMTIGCFLAAADIPGIELCFIGGKRKDGVVITGTEKNLRLEPNFLHRERAVATAEELYKSGALEAIAPLLQPFGAKTEDLSLFSMCQAHRQNLRFERARQIAAKCHHPSAITLRSHLDKLCSADRSSADFVAEVFCGADRLRNWGKDTQAFLAYYQSIEFAARTALSSRHSVSEPYDLDLISSAPSCTSEQVRKYRANARDGKLHLGLHGLHETLLAFGDSSANTYFQNQSLRTMLNRRNEFVHTGQSPETGLIKALANHTRAHLLSLLPKIDLDLPARLWSDSLLTDV
jgi:hypothetical protein